MNDLYLEQQRKSALRGLATSF